MFKHINASQLVPTFSSPHGGQAASLVLEKVTDRGRMMLTKAPSAISARGSRAGPSWEELPEIDFKRSAKKKCLPLTISPGNKWGMTEAMYGKGLEPNSREFFTDKRGSFRFLSMISSSRLMLRNMLLTRIQCMH